MDTWILKLSVKWREGKLLRRKSFMKSKRSNIIAKSMVGFNYFKVAILIKILGMYPRKQRISFALLNSILTKKHDAR